MVTFRKFYMNFVQWGAWGWVQDTEPSQSQDEEEQERRQDLPAQHPCSDLSCHLHQNDLIKMEVRIWWKTFIPTIKLALTFTMVWIPMKKGYMYMLLVIILIYSNICRDPSAWSLVSSLMDQNINESVWQELTTLHNNILHLEPRYLVIYPGIIY